MHVVVSAVRVWRKRMRKRREEVQASGARFGRHVRRAEEDVTRRIVRRVREQEAVMKTANLTYERREDDPQHAAAVELERVEAAFGEVAPSEDAVQIDLSLAAEEGQSEPSQGKKGGDKAREGKRPSLVGAAKAAVAGGKAEKRKDRRKKGQTAGGGDSAGEQDGAEATKSSVTGEFEAEKALDDADSTQFAYDSDRFRDVCHAAADRLRLKAAEEREKRERKAKKKTKDASPDAVAVKDVSTPTEAAPSPLAGTAEDGKGDGDEDDDDDGLFVEDEGAKCEEAVLKYIQELRRLFRNACESEEASAGAASLPSPSSASRAAASAAPSVTAVAPGWLLTRVHFGRLLRKYKILSKTCSAQFIDSLWDDLHSGARRSAGADPSADPAAPTDDGALTFDDFLECLVRIAAVKWTTEASLYDRFHALLSRDLFPALKGPSPLADFRTSLALTCEPVFDTHNRFLSQIFRAYSSDRESSGGVQEPAMTRKDFEEFIEGTALLTRKVIAVRTVSVLWGCAQMDEEGEAGEGLFGGSSSMVFWEFLEGLSGLACYYERNPFLTLDTRLQMFIEYLQDGCPQVETKRRVYAAKMQGGGGGGGAAAANSGAASAAAAAGATLQPIVGKGGSSADVTPRSSRPASGSSTRGK